MATLGQQLKAAREAKGISQSEAGTATKILTRIIAAMEADDFSGMAAPTYAKGFIRLYAAFLRLNPDPLIEEYMAKHAPGRKPLIVEENRLEESRGKRPSVPVSLKRLPAKLNPLTWFSAPIEKFSKGLKPYVVRDIRALAIGTAVVLVLLVLIVSVSNCVRRHAAGKPVQQQAEAPARRLLDKPLPDLYLVEPGKIESSR
ncbi:MAG: helix-turn-helix domain-containing protein [Kiritimatiellales bacterium]|jgi:transcriptional regulator with XRE-family HTH domain